MYDKYKLEIVGGMVYRGYKNDKSDELGLKLAKAITVTIEPKRTPKLVAESPDRSPIEILWSVEGREGLSFIIVEKCFLNSKPQLAFK